MLDNFEKINLDEVICGGNKSEPDTGFMDADGRTGTDRYAGGEWFYHYD